MSQVRVQEYVWGSSECQFVSSMADYTLKAVCHIAGATTMSERGKHENVCSLRGMLRRCPLLYSICVFS